MIIYDSDTFFMFAYKQLSLHVRHESLGAIDALDCRSVV